VPLQRLLKFDGDVAQWKVQRAASLKEKVDHSLVLTPGKWQIRLDGLGKEGETRSYISPILDLEPEVISSTEFTEYVQ